ncbi:MAG: pirin family protein [Bacteroidia bacterium]
MKNSIIHKANSRGHANHGWLDTHHTFSFANYYEPDRMSFGVLRVLNDDIIEGGAGFGKHPHDNMEIISIPIYGALAHKDSMGNASVIKESEVQVMSAGTGILHSEFNGNENKKANFLQIWIFPNEKNVTSRYDQKQFDISERQNKFQQVVSPFYDKEGLSIHQDAWMNLANLDKEIALTYQRKKEGNGIYIFIIDGEVKIDDQTFEKRDGIGITDRDSVSIKALSDSQILVMDIPMTV